MPWTDLVARRARRSDAARYAGGAHLQHLPQGKQILQEYTLAPLEPVGARARQRGVVRPPRSVPPAACVLLSLASHALMPARMASWRNRSLSAAPI